MSSNIGDNRKLFPKLKTKMGYIMLNLELNPKILPENTLNLVETQHLPDIEKVDSKDDISCLKRTVYNGRRKICINFQTGTDNVNIVVNRYRNKTYLKDTETD